MKNPNMPLDGKFFDENEDTESLTATNDSASTAFVDSTRPPDVKVLPPAKYKLWLLVYCCVFCAIVVTEEARYLDFLRFDGWLSPNTSFFIMLATIDFTLTYGTLDLVVTIFTLKIGDKQYGLGPWLKAPRIQWIHRENNFFAECLRSIILIFEDGFAMFDAPINDNSNSSAPDHHHKVFDCKHGCKADLKITHRINPAKMKEYRRWRQKITAACKTQPGLLHVERDSAMEYKIVQDDKNDLEADLEDALEADLEAPTVGRKESSGDYQSGTKQEEEAFRHTVTLTFENVDYLNDWMMSPRRQAYMANLKPLLLTPNVTEVQRDRVLPDAFTDLMMHRHGEAMSSLPPKKWKVWWLATLALYMTIQWTNSTSFMPYYLQQWGLDKTHPYTRIMVDALVVTFMNSYVMIPLLMFIFDPWVQRRAGEVDSREPWRTLNDGVQQTWIKALISFPLYGGCIIAWMWRAYYGEIVDKIVENYS